MANNVATFADFVRQHEPALLRFIRRWVGSTEDAEDIAQEAMMRVYRTRERAAAGAGVAKARGHSALGGWLYTIARNLSIDHLRRKRERILTDEEFAVAASDQPSPQAIYERAVEIDELRKALRMLPGHYRRVLDLRFHEGLSYRDIAKQLSVPVTTVEARLHRARRMLRRVLGNRLDD